MTWSPNLIEINDTETPYQVRVHVVNSTRTIYGRAKEKDADTSQAIWQIWAIDGVIDTHRHYAVKDSVENREFVHIWDTAENDPNSLFPGTSFFNNYSTEFNGVSRYLNGGDILQYDAANQWSLSFWAKVDNTSAQRAFYAKTGGASVYGWGLYHNSSGQMFLQMRTTSTLRQYTGTTVLSAGTWYHIVMTYDGSSNINGIRIYINGSVEPTPGSGSIGGSLLGGYDAFFGQREGAFRLSGKMDEISTWNKSLSSSEVASIYNTGSPNDVRDLSFAANLVNFWRLGDDDIEPTIADNEGTDDLAMVGFPNGYEFETDIP